MKFKTPHIILLVFILFSALNADCQRFNTVNFTTQEGLPGNQLNSIFQDKIGRLWKFNKQAVDEWVKSGAATDTQSGKYPK